MTIVHCPRCRDEVTVPANSSPRALVRCPLCLEEYLLSEALAEMPPALLVVGGDDEDEPALIGAGVAAAEAGGDYGVAAGFGGAFDSSAPAGAKVTPARTAVKGARPRRKPRSAVVELIKIVLGGVAGISIAIVGLWWFGQDPFQLGPKVAPYAPWIVPAKFHGKTTEPETTVQNGTTSRTSGGTAPNGSVANSKGKNKGQPATEVDPLEFPADPLAGEPGIINPVAPASIDFPSLDPVPATTPRANPRASPTAVPPANVDFTNLLPDGVPAKPAATAADLTKAVEASLEALAKFEEATANKESKEIRQQRFTDLYLAVAEAGRVMSHLDPADADVVNPQAELKQLLSDLAVQAGKVSAIGHLGRTHLPERKAGEGFAAIGTVLDFRSAGGAYETTLDAGNDVRVLMVSSGNPQDFCKVGDQLLVVGRIVLEPAKNIRNYDGDAERVVLLGEAWQVSQAPAPPAE